MSAADADDDANKIKLGSLAQSNPTKGFASMENGRNNIRVNTLAPGFTETPMVQVASAQNPAFANQNISNIPARRGAQSCEVAAAAVWLCSAEASHVFGQMLVVDGGMTIGGFEFYS